MRGISLLHATVWQFSGFERGPFLLPGLAAYALPMIRWNLCAKTVENGRVRQWSNQRLHERWREKSRLASGDAA